MTTALEVSLHEEKYVVIPHGMTPKLFHKTQGKPIAYVEGWTSAGEFEQSYFNLYPLEEERQMHIHFKASDGTDEILIFYGFGEPTHQALRANGTLHVREHEKTMTA
ncbi:MAG: hypothetical protein HYX27_11955 [Acidobacteria bacterium]|nr:hypothetical protein [Acidobacteriota bacterium]